MPISAESEPLLPSNASSSKPSRWRFWQKWNDVDGDMSDAAVAAKTERRRRIIKRVAVCGVILLLGVGIGVGADRLAASVQSSGDGPMVPPVFKIPPPTGLPRNRAYPVNGSTAAVASEDVTCSELGLHILRDKNGTAVDAAITTTLCIGLLNAFASGIGGGGFMVVRIPDSHPRNTFEAWSRIYPAASAYPEEAAAMVVGETDRVVAVDFREVSPSKSEKEMYGSKRAGRVAAQVGGLAVGVPGELRGLEAAHRLYGTLPWKELVMPVAELAKGWFVSRELARRLRVFGQFMLENPTWARIYAPRGYLLVEGEYVQRLAYGQTLERIAHEGASAFYDGDIAKSMVSTVRRQGGIMTIEDLRSYKARVYPAIHQTYHDKTIYTTGPPSSGGILLGFMNILEGWPMESYCTKRGLSADGTHLLMEAMKMAFGARSEVTDPAFAKNISRLEEFVTKAWGDETRSRITNHTHPLEYYGLQFDTPIDHGTTHLSIVDSNGGAASVTSTVNLIWGSHVMDPSTGVIFNDEQDDFSVPGAADAFGLWPSPWNYPAPGKRPLSSTSANIIETTSSDLSHKSGELWAVLGGSGGSRIFPSIAQILIQLIHCHREISTAIELPRYHDQIYPPGVSVEVGPDGEDAEVVGGLEARGHKVQLFDINLGVAEVQGVVLQGGKVWAASDSRKNGIAAAY